jgi:hypothetical protein
MDTFTETAGLALADTASGVLGLHRRIRGDSETQRSNGHLPPRDLYTPCARLQDGVRQQGAVTSAELLQ